MTVPSEWGQLSLSRGKRTKQSPRGSHAWLTKLCGGTPWTNWQWQDRKTERFHKLHHCSFGFPKSTFRILHSTRRLSDWQGFSHVSNRAWKRPLQLSYLLKRQLHSWLTGAPPSGPEKVKAHVEEKIWGCLHSKCIAKARMLGLVSFKLPVRTVTWSLTISRREQEVSAKS